MGSCYFEKYVRRTDQLTDLLTKGMLTTVHWNSLLTSGKPDDLVNQMISGAFLHKLFSCSASGKQQAMSQVMTQSESVDWMWSQYATKVLKSGCALGSHLVLERFTSCEFHCTQDKRDLLAGMLFWTKAEGNLSQIGISCEIFRTRRV